MNNILQKTKSNTLKDTVAERHHKFTGNQPGDNRSPRIPYRGTPNLLHLLRCE
jgi:hypothetical protein